MLTRQHLQVASAASGQGSWYVARIDASLEQKIEQRGVQCCGQLTVLRPGRRRAEAYLEPPGWLQRADSLHDFPSQPRLAYPGRSRDAHDADTVPPVRGRPLTPG